MEAATHVSAASIPWRSPTRETSWGLNRQRWSMQRDSYQQAGVDIAAGDRAVDLMRKAVAGAVTPGVLGDIGGFGGGVAAGCRQAHCARVGGETAEMPGFYPVDEYDLAGFCVGLVDRSHIVDGHTVRAGDVLVGLPSSGLHSNGFSLVRHIVFDQHHLDVSTYVPELGRTVGEELLEPTIIYVDAAARARAVASIGGMAHITGGGLLGNIPRVVPEGLRVELDIRSWQVSPVFDWLTRLGMLEEQERYQTFNMGLGFVFIVREASVDSVCKALAGDGARAVGRIVPGDPGVELCR